MNNKLESARPTDFTRRLLPWLLAGGMFTVYALTLNHWISPDSLRHIADLGGLTWSTDLSGPVGYLATYPIRWLPARSIPLAANLFSAFCAALTLALLARSVALLPHPRGRGNESENMNPTAQLIQRNAWLPPALAVLVFGLQLSFWEQATTAAGGMIDALLFAYLIRCLLEYRVNPRESWLLRFAFVNGLAMADDWAMVAFLPGFLLALLWFLGLPRFFNPRFITDVLKRRVKPINGGLTLRLLAVWLAGGSLFLLLPLVASHSHRGGLSFWTGLGFAMRSHQIMLGAFPLHLVLLLSVTSVLPIIFMGLRWRRLTRDNNPWAKFITNAMFHAVRGFFLAACLLTMLDSPFSPRHLQPLFPCLPLYYLTALGIGFYSGHFLVAFSQRSRRSRARRSTKLEVYANLGSIGAMCGLMLLVPALLVYKNLPLIHRQNNGVLDAYYDVLLKSLPVRGAIIMSEDPTRLYYLQEALIRGGRASDYALVDTSLLTAFPDYVQFLDRLHRDFQITESLGATNAELTSPPVLTKWIQDLSQRHELYLMHPFVGYLAERFYAEPREMLYQLHPYPTNAIEPPAMSAALLADNRQFWKQVSDEQFPALLRHFQPDKSGESSPLARLLRFVHAQPEPDRSARMVANGYSLMLDGWGVVLQRRGSLTEAGDWFATARQLNPENNSAQINLACNRNLQARRPMEMESNKQLEDYLGRHRNWDQSLRQDGPVDDPNSCYRLGVLFNGSHMYRQGLQQFLRAQQLAPDATNAPARLADLYAQMADYTNALAEADLVLRLAPDNSRALLVKGLSLVKMGKFSEAIPALNDALNLHADDTSARLVRALAYLKLNKFLAAQEDYTQVAQTAPTAYPAYYGLAEIARQSKDNAATIRNCELYLSNAPASAAETQQIRDWLKEIKTKGD